MGKSTTFSNDILALIFNGTPIANLADNAASSPLTNLYMALHTADPGAAGNQTTNESSYTGYARVAVVRTGSGWSVNAGSVSPNSNVSWPQCTGGSGTATYISVGTVLSGTGKILYSGAVTPGIAYSNGVVPQMTPSSSITEA